MKRIAYWSLTGYFAASSILLILLIIILICGTSRSAVSRTSTNRYTVVLDCGHGGPDGGAVAADGTLEKDINLALGYELREILIQNGYSVIMTRETDDFICDDHSASLREQNVSDLHNRLSIAQSYPDAIFISLHMNQFSDPRYSGSQLFYGPKNAHSRILADSIRSRLLAGVQRGNERALKEMDSSVYIIYNAHNPALLLECGFMSNIAELNQFKTGQYRSKFAFETFLGINDFFNNMKG